MRQDVGGGRPEETTALLMRLCTPTEDGGASPQPRLHPPLPAAQGPHAN